MNYLHQNQPPIIHRDLKSLNVLLTNPIRNTSDSISAKVTDFGIACIMENQH